MSNDENVTRQKTTAYYLAHFLNMARGRRPSSANHTSVHSFVESDGGLVDSERFRWTLIDEAMRLEAKAKRYRTAAKAVEFWVENETPEPMGMIAAALWAWELAEQEALKNVS